MGQSQGTTVTTFRPPQPGEDRFPKPHPRPPWDHLFPRPKPKPPWERQFPHPKPTPPWRPTTPWRPEDMVYWNKAGKVGQ